MASSPRPTYVSSYLNNSIYVFDALCLRAWHTKLRFFAHCIPANPGRYLNAAEHRKAAVSASVSISIKSAAIFEYLAGAQTGAMYTVASSKTCDNRATSVMPGV